MLYKAVKLAVTWGLGGVLLTVGYMGRLYPKGVPFCTCRIRRGREIYCLIMLKVAEIHLKLKRWQLILSAKKSFASFGRKSQLKNVPKLGAFERLKPAMIYCFSFGFSFEV